jgi:hypothetical protein
MLSELKAAAVPWPPLPLPKWDPTRITQRVEIPRVDLRAAVAVLKERHPPGTHPKWGVNYLPKGRAVLVAEAGIDLAAMAAAAAGTTPDSS